MATSSDRQQLFEVMHRGARRAFAQVVEHRGQQYLPLRIVAEDHQVQVVATVQRLRVQVWQRALSTSAITCTWRWPA